MSKSNPERKPYWKGLGIGVVVGAIGLAIIGFAWGGWYTASSAETAVTKAVDLALKPVVEKYFPDECVALANADPEMATKIADINKTQYGKDAAFIKTGWVDVPYNLSAANKGILVKLCMPLVVPAPTEASAAPASG